MILAAGKGERMRPKPGDPHKSLLPAGGEPLIVRTVRRLADAGFSPLVVNVSDRSGQIIDALGDGGAFGNQVLYSEEEEALETAGGIANALPLLGDGVFLAANADVYTTVDLPGLRDGGLRAMGDLGTLAHLALVPNPPHNPAGDFGLEGRLATRPDGARPLTYSGVGLFDPAAFKGVGKREKARLASILFPLAEAGKVSGERTDATWFDVGTPERHQELLRHLDKAGA